MDSFDKDNWPRKLAGLLFLALSFMVIVALALYALLWVAAIGNPHRLTPALELYAAFWSIAAIGAAIYNIRMVVSVIKRRERKSLLKVLAVSCVCVASCPEWFY